MKNRIPKFKSYEEEAKFWDSHDFSEFWVGAKPVKLEFVDNTNHGEVITVRVQPKLKAKLEEIARSKGVNLSSLARMWFIEKLRQVS